MRNSPRQRHSSAEPSEPLTPTMVSTPGEGTPSNGHHRYSAFDTTLFALNQAASSPTQARKALESHLLETDRRIHEASKLGTALVKQRTDLATQLKEVTIEAENGAIGPQLRQKLIDIEQEYNEVGRQSAKVLLGPRNDQPKRDVSGPFALDGRVGHLVLFTFRLGRICASFLAMEFI